jgi:hypothetical protein
MLSRALLVGLLAACSPGPRGAVVPDAASDASDEGGGVRCSGDLHDIVDAKGNVITTCPDDQGCAGGLCVDACLAAAASQGAIGCDFTIATPSMFYPDAPPCFAAFLANNWPVTATVTITRDGTSYDPSAFGRVPDGTADAASWPAIDPAGIASSSVGVLFLSHDPTSTNNNKPTTCPVVPAISISGGTAIYTGSAAATGIGAAFHITTSVPVTAYDILPFGGASSWLPSAELVLPTTAWGTNYIAAGPQRNMGPGWGQVVASVDHTTVQITPVGDLPAGPGVVAAPATTTTSYTLDAGQFIQWHDAGDMAGSVITATDPVGFTAGTDYLCLMSATSTGGGCDSAHQQIPPVSALGSEYVAPPYATRRADLQPESIKYRLVGAVDGTVLSFTPQIANAPATLDRGQVVEIETTLPFIVAGQDTVHPFYLGQYMSGCLTTSGSRPGDPRGCLGDEEFVNILPPAQWLRSYVFFTDPSYTTTNLVAVRHATASGFHDVTIDCLGTIGGWQPVTIAGAYEITNVDLQRMTPVGSCTNGRHVATSDGDFTIMVWGLASYASYAYPAGGNVAKINPVVVVGRER